MNKIKVALLVFVLVCVLDIVGVLFNISVLTLLFKPFILLSLIVLYVVSVVEKNKVYIIALIFSFFGDVFLMIEGELYFIVGLFSFLIAHILFIKLVVSRIKNTTNIKIIVSTILFSLVFSLLIFIIINSLGEFLIPVIIYGLTISTFGAVALIDFLNTSSKKSLFMLFGAFVFIISDAVLAINKFYQPQHLLEVAVMVTYVTAQYLIYRSVILDEK